MVIKYDTKMIESVLYDFYNATGMSIILLREDLTTIYNDKNKDSSYCASIKKCHGGREACRCSDNDMLMKAKETRKAQFHICHAGLIDMVIPIIYNDTIIGYVIFGQIRNKEKFDEVKHLISGFDVDINKMEKHYSELPFYDKEKLKSISNIAVMLAKYVMTEKMIKATMNEVLESATGFINDNLSEQLSVDYITRNINVCKSVLYKNFKSAFNCTVSQYINRKRVEKAVDYLLSTDLSMEEISQRVGFSSAAYFTANFKKLKGVSPIKFKKNQNKNGHQ